MESKIISISGTSGAGKTFLVDKIIKKFPNITEIAGVTTRPKREEEVEGQSSHFLTLERFNELDIRGQLVLVKEFFGNKYAWFKKDLTNENGLRIMNISYKSIRELKNNLDMISIFVRPESEEKLKQMLRSRTKSNEEYEKRLKDYYESEKFIEESPQDFDLIFTNCYDEKSAQELLEYINSIFMINDKIPTRDSVIEVMGLIEEAARLDHQITLADELLTERQIEGVEEKKSDK